MPEVRRPIAFADYAEGSDKVLSDPSWQPRLLEVKKVAGPAPFVGDPLIYQGFYCWLAAIDDLGRHVAGEATLEIGRR